MTRKCRCQRALEYKATMMNEGMWLGFGGQAQWADDQNPPSPDPLATELLTPIGYRRAQIISMVSHEEDGPIYYLGQRYILVDDDTALANNELLLYVMTGVNYDELPNTMYRQLGMFRGLVPKPEYSALNSLLPNQVDSLGVLDIVDNIIPASRTDFQRDEYSYMIQF